MVSVQYLGAFHAKGEGKNGHYDFAQVRYVQPSDNVSNEKRKLIAHGGEERTIDLDPSALHEFEGLKIGQQVTLKVGPNPRNLRANICTGVEKQ